MRIGNNFRHGSTFLTDSGNTRRRFRTRSRLSLYVEADPRRKNLCRSHLGPCGHRRGAFAGISSSRFQSREPLPDLVGCVAIEFPLHYREQI
jgi:hypothetical protein